MDDNWRCYSLMGESIQRCTRFSQTNGPLGTNCKVIKESDRMIMICSHTFEYCNESKQCERYLVETKRIYMDNK